MPCLKKKENDILYKEFYKAAPFVAFSQRLPLAQLLVNSAVYTCSRTIFSETV